MKNLLKIKSFWQTLVTRVANFDIKPAVTPIPGLLEKAQNLYSQQQYAEAAEILQQVLRYSPTNTIALQTLADVYIALKKPYLAIKLFKIALKYEDKNIDLYLETAKTCNIVGYRKLSAYCYSRVLELEPCHISAKHLLDSVQNNTTNAAPTEYIESLFDHYAPRFEYSLVECLDYKIPKIMVEYLKSFYDSIENCLDLGCGTGLLGNELHSSYSTIKLDGVDLSSKMLELAKERNIYKNLYQAELTAHLQNIEKNYDLITASDVLIYFGDLEPVIKNARERLNRGGMLAFTTETLITKKKVDYKLSISGRYQHSLAYLESIAKKLGFNKIYPKDVALRKEYGNIVPGYLVLLQK